MLPRSAKQNQFQNGKHSPCNDYLEDWILPAILTSPMASTKSKIWGSKHCLCKVASLYRKNARTGCSSIELLECPETVQAAIRL